MNETTPETIHARQRKSKANNPQREGEHTDKQSRFVEHFHSFIQTLTKLRNIQFLCEISREKEDKW